MATKSHITKWGTSLAVRIPKSIAEQGSVREGSPIEIIPQDDRVVLRKRAYDLVRMLHQVTPGNVPAAQDFGPPQGHEAW